MRFNLSLVFLVILFSFNSYSQKEIDTIGSDIFDNFYYVKEDVLFKKNTKSLKNYKNLALGKLESVDILTPLELVLFYQDYNSVVILDNNLNQIVSIQFSETILFARKGITNNIWRYNDSQNRVELYDYKSKKITSFSQIISDFIPIKMESNYNYVKLVGEKKTLVYNQYLYLTETIIH